MGRINIFRSISIAMILLGLFFLLKSTGITGAVVGMEQPSSSTSLIIGSSMIIVAITIMAHNETLEEKLRKIPTLSPIVLQDLNPIIFDANYLIDSTKDETKYKKFKQIIERYTKHAVNPPLIIPKKVRLEFNRTPKHIVYISKDEKNTINTRRQNIKNYIEKNTTTLEELRSDFYGPLTEMGGKRKNIYVALATELLQQTPKYLTYLYIEEMNTNGVITPRDFLNKLKTSHLSNKNPYNDREILNELYKGQNEYSQNKNNPYELRKLLNRYALKDKDDNDVGDIEILANAIFLQNVPHKIGESRLNTVTILTNDEHLLQVQRIYDARYRPIATNKSYKGRVGKIIIKPTL